MVDPTDTSDAVRVEFALDVVCAWSYLAFARYRRAATRYRATGGAVLTVFQPFQLRPDASAVGEPLTEVHRRDLGSNAAENIRRMTALAARDGLRLNFEKAVFTNTFDAHRLIVVAAAQSRAEAVTERLFRAYFADGLNIADPTVLRGLAEETGTRWSEGYIEQTRQALADVLAAGVKGVPQFVIGAGHRLVGAQSEQTLFEALSAHRGRS